MVNVAVHVRQQRKIYSFPTFVFLFAYTLREVFNIKYLPFNLEILNFLKE